MIYRRVQSITFTKRFPLPTLRISPPPLFLSVSVVDINLTGGYIHHIHTFAICHPIVGESPGGYVPLIFLLLKTSVCDKCPDGILCQSLFNE